MATEEITISELELADMVLADMTIPVDTATDTKAVTLKQLRAWLGSSLPTGFIIPAVGKINDARFTLLDGKTLSRIGTYEAFCNKVVEQVQAGNWPACSEEEYNADVSAYGQCGKFVVTNDYVRIPKITRFIGATITLSEIGKTYAESLPNITGSVDTGTRKTDSVNEMASGSLYISEYGSKQGVYGSGGNAYNYQLVSIDASRSSETYKEGAKVHPEHTKYPYYMVVSTEGQTAEVEIDINQVYEDLELKANKNLSNISANIDYIVEEYKNGDDWFRVYKSGWVEQGGRVVPTTSWKEVILLKPMADSYYSVMVTNCGEDATKYTVKAGTPSKNTTTTVYMTAGNASTGVYWVVKGRGA